MILLALSGKKRVGKNTVAKLIEQQLIASNYPHPIYTLAFADELKQEVAKACSVTMEYIEANKDTFRIMLQWWGTDFKRKLIKDSYWTDIIMRKLAGFPQDCVVIITDCRFENEYKMLQYVGAYMIRIIRLTNFTDTHSSETNLDNSLLNWDLVIDNNGSLEALEEKVNGFVKKEIIKK